MKRFYFGSEGEEDEDNNDEDSDSFESPHISEFMAMTGPVESPFKYLMDFSLRICERNMFWRFVPVVDKIRLLKEVFNSMTQIEEEYERDADI